LSIKALRGLLLYLLMIVIIKQMDIENRVNKMAFDLERLIEKAEIWQLLFDECPLGVAVFDSNMKFFLINNAFTEMTGYTTDILGKDIKEVVPVRFRKAHRKSEKLFAAQPEKKTNRHGLSPYILKTDGGELPIDIDLSYIKYDSAIYYVSFIRRIS
jgi:PAS domain S-box-containing protein